MKRLPSAKSAYKKKILRYVSLPKKRGRIFAGYILPVLALLLASYVPVWPLFNSEYFPIHDDTQVVRVIEMGRALRDGQFPVRWVADLGFGYGYPIFNFYGPLPYYIGGMIYAVGVPALVATKIMFGAGVILPSIVLFAVTRGVVGWQGALVASILYLYAPYHAVQVYVRGAVGEYWILMFWPLLLHAALRAGENRYRARSMLIGAIGLAGSILSHTLLGYATAFFWGAGAFLYAVIHAIRNRFDKRAYIVPAGVMVGGLGLSAFFWLPAVFEMGYTNVAAQISNTANYHDHFLCMIQLWSSAWGFGGSAAGCFRDGMSFMLGKIHILVSGIVLAGWIIGRVTYRRRLYVMYALVCTFTGIFLTLSVSKPIWAILPMFAYMQYPWRFLALASFGSALLGGAAVTLIRNHVWRAVAAGVASIMLIVVNGKWFVPQYLYHKDSRAFETSSDIMWRASKISYEYLPKEVLPPTRESAVMSDTIVSSSPIAVTAVTATAVEKKFIVESTQAARLTIHTAYFPGWRYRINGQNIEPIVLDGLPRVSVDAGRTVVELRFTDTPVRRAANIVSMITVVMMGYVYVTHKKTIS